MPDSRPVAGGAVSPICARPIQDWRVLVAIFWITSMVEGMGVNQIFAEVPTYLREMGVQRTDRLAFVGLFSSLIVVVGGAVFLVGALAIALRRPRSSGQPWMATES